MEEKYLTSNLWLSFKEECPIISKTPILGMFAFGCFVREYFKQKLPHNIAP